jgi:prefoldin subunit 5
VYELSPNDPALRYIGKALTIGNLSAAVTLIDDTRSALAKTQAKLESQLANLNQRIDRVETETKARIKAAELAEAAKQARRT